MIFNRERSELVGGGAIAGIIVFALLFLSLGIPLIYFGGWLFGNIAVFFFGDTISIVFETLKLSAINADTFPTVCGVLSVFFHIIIPSNPRFNTNKN